ncbi:MAG: hypothetical protein JJLCMIEE_00536 [Acidimicrobiales bacterium]|nr:MAG: VOC family protein [Actinomycetota bacterium]MBV6507488.1 hypothetical protein [Acidimicrobiales bacterium]RIK07865.1 MAG: glyoxalase [Acidobacteriota bacterium]
MFLEHVNLNVADVERTARFYEEVFDFKRRWEGDGMAGMGRTVHVGTDDTYLALYQPHEKTQAAPGVGEISLNHVGIVVDDLDEIDHRLEARGVDTFNHGSYEPGRRFYFLDPDGVEIEVVSYP